MTTPTTNMSLAKGTDTDNAEVYLTTNLGAALDTLDAHDHSVDAKGLAIKRIQSGLDAAKPGAGSAAGLLYVATDTSKLYFSDGTTTIALQASITGTIIIPLGGGATSIVGGTTAYIGAGVTSVTESNGAIPLAAPLTITKLYVVTNTAPGTGQSYTFTLRKNNADTLITCSIGGISATSANDTAHSVSYLAGDLIDVKIVSSGGAATAVPNASVST